MAHTPTPRSIKSTTDAAPARTRLTLACATSLVAIAVGATAADHLPWSGAAAVIPLVAPTAAPRLSTADLTQQVNATLGLTASRLFEFATVRKAEEPFSTVVPVNGNLLTIDLEPSSLRAPNYKLLVQDATGELIEADPGPSVTMRGSIRGLQGTQVAGSLLDDGLYLSLRMPAGERFFVEPVGRRVPGAKAADHVVYNITDVIPNGGTCGVEQTPRQMLIGAAVKAREQADQADGGKPQAAEAPAGGVAGAPSGVAGGLGSCIAEIAFDADFEFFQTWGSVSAAQNRISTIINAVNVQYETEVGITHTITTIIVRSAEPDPYSSTDPGTLLDQMQNHWNTAQSAVVRDMAQLFTGKELAGSTIGLATLAQTCNEFNAYSLVQSDCCGPFGCSTDLTAHELGHTWSATHCSCPSFTMNPSLTCVNTFHPTESVPEIIAFRDSLTCLDCTPPCGEPGQQTNTVATDAAANDQLGDAVGVFSGPAGDRAVAGARLDNNGAGTDAGSAYVFRRNSGTQWVQEQKLLAADAAASDQFGTAVAMEGDSVVVGSPLDNNGGGSDAGSAYVYLRSGTSWSQQAKLLANDPAANDQFGTAVAIFGDRAIIGVPLDDNGAGVDAGAAYVYVRSGTTWTLEQKLLHDPAATNDRFGTAVAIHGDYAVIGAPNDDDPSGIDAGSAFIFKRDGSNWTQTDKLLAADLQASDFFGAAVSIRGDYAAVGAPGEDADGAEAGAAYIFHRDGELWPEQIKLTASDGTAGFDFGEAVAITEDHALIGAKDASVFGVGSGSAYLFIRGGTDWTELQIVRSSDAVTNDDFGAALAMVPTISIIGAPLNNISGITDAGSSYAFSIPGGDCNSNGVSDECDLLDGFSADCNDNDIPDECDISSGLSSDVNVNGIPDECEADCNGSGQPNDFDISSGASEDCNGNGVPDECDLTNRTSADCNADGIPDECQDAVVALDSQDYSPLQAGFNPSMFITSPLQPTGDVTLSFSASGDLGFSSENVAVDLNGTALEVLWGTAGSGADCSNPPNAATIVVPLATWQAIVGSADAEITMTPSPGVDSSICVGGSFISCSVTYTATAELDSDGNGVIDSCDETKTTPGDLDGDGDVDGLDLAALLADWGPCPGCPADLDGDGDVDGLDLALLLAAWG